MLTPTKLKQKIEKDEAKQDYEENYKRCIKAVEDGLVDSAKKHGIQNSYCKLLIEGVVTEELAFALKGHFTIYDWATEIVKESGKKYLKVSYQEPLKPGEYRSLGDWINR
jgi:hypothetical protein